MKTKFLLASLLMLASAGLYAQDGNEPVKKYGFKSAIVKYTTDIMGQKVESTTYIEDFGAKECQKVKMDVPGMGEMETAVITKDGKSWAVNYAMKSVQENPVNQPNFSKLTDEDIKKYNIKEVGKDTFLDKECVVYTMENEAQGMKANIKVWTYKGLGLKQETDISGMKITATATEFTEDATVLPQVFDIPKF